MKTLNHNKKIIRSSYSAYVVEGSELEALFSDDFNPLSLFKSPETLLKTNGAIIAALVRLPLKQSKCEKTVFAKKYTLKKYRHYIKVWMGLERAPRVFRVSQQLLSAGIPVPAPLACILLGRGLFRRESIYLCEAIEGCHDLRYYDRGQQHLDILKKLNVLPRVIQTMAKMHELGFVHGDFKWGNVLIKESTGEHWLIDLDSVRLVKQNKDFSLMARDLARFLLNGREGGLNIGAENKMLEYYANCRGLNTAYVRKTTKPILSKLERRHQEKYGRAAY